MSTAGMYRADWDRMMEDTQRFTTEIDNTINDTSALDNVNSETALDAENVAAANARARGRYGIDLTQSQSSALNSAQGLNTAIGKAQNYNNTRLGLQERNQQLLKQKVGLGRGILNLGQQAGTTATNLDNSQKLQQTQAASQQSSSLWKVGATVLGTAIGAMV
jgi:hypothetical protein